jgi:hypothetical protein
VSFPDPHPGLVIRHAFLWKRELDEGREEGSKERPYAIVLSVLDDNGEYEVIVLPITHSPAERPEDAIEIPPATKQRLGLDSERSWIEITEANEFAWPGPDLRPASGRDDSAILHGTLPPKFVAHVRNRFLGRIADDKAQTVKRTD